jgi:hypothetical protein
MSVELVEEPRADWSVWSVARDAWLRQDALGWCSKGEPAGRWDQATASEHAENLPADDWALAEKSPA